MYFPVQISNLIKDIFEENSKLSENVEEVRIRVGRPLILKTRQTDFVIDHIVTQTEIIQILEKMCENSIYAYKNQFCEGFITIKGGHRIGITGSAVVENGKVINIKYVTSLNVRVARQVFNCSNKIIKEIIDVENDMIYNTLIVAPPGKGKTTMLRDIIRKISNGIDEIDFRGKNCGVVDERGEIAAIYRGIPQNDVGIRTDVIENISKAKGMKMLIRSMAPEVIACDEIGSEEDVEAIRRSTVLWSKRDFYNAC